MFDSWHLLCTQQNSLPPLPSSSSPSLVFPVLLLLPPLQVALSVKGGGERHVVKGSGGGVGPFVGRHASDAVLRLVRGELPPQLISCDEVLMENSEDSAVNVVYNLQPGSAAKSCIKLTIGLVYY